jgi:hypothetical protein
MGVIVGGAEEDMQMNNDTVANLQAKFETLLAGGKSVSLSRGPLPPHADPEFTQAAGIIYLPDLTGTGHNASR